MSEGPIAGDALDAAMAQTMLDMAAEGDALYELSQTRGYAVIMRLLERIELDIGRHGLRDRATPREYYMGAQDMVSRLKGIVPLMVARGADAEAARMATEKPEFVRRFVAGDGGLS
jgi:hypothetical protein